MRAQALGGVLLVVLAISASVAGAAGRPGGPGDGPGSVAECEARALSLSRAMGRADRRFAGLAFRLQFARAGCSDIPELGAAATAAAFIVDGMRMQAARCPVAMDFAADLRAAEASVDDLALVVDALRAACGR